MAQIYLASSWRNADQPHFVALLREAGHAVYDFRNPGPGSCGFAWSQIDPDWQNWTAEQYRNALTHPVAMHGYADDFGGMNWADTCVLLLPCGRSAHLEAGWMKGAGKRLVVVTRDGEEPELMAKMADHIVIGEQELLSALGGLTVSIGATGTYTAG